MPFVCSPLDYIYNYEYNGIDRADKLPAKKMKEHPFL